MFDVTLLIVPPTVFQFEDPRWHSEAFALLAGRGTVRGWRETDDM